MISEDSGGLFGVLLVVEKRSHAGPVRNHAAREVLQLAHAARAGEQVHVVVLEALDRLLNETPLELGLRPYRFFGFSVRFAAVGGGLAG